MTQPKAIISAILEKEIDGEKYVFVQTRWKPKVSPTYSGLLEMPAGAIDSYENVYDTLCREVKEETGLTVVKVIDDYKSQNTENRPNDINFVFRPFICHQTLSSNGGLPWVGFVFRCEVEGEIKMQQDEAKDPRWVSIKELKKILTDKPDLIFPLHFPILEYYVSGN